MDTDIAQLDTEAVARWLVDALPGFEGPIEAQKFASGQSNPTYRLTTPNGTYVLRRKPPGVLLKSAHAVDREYRVQKALAETDVPVPRMLALCLDETVIGTAFYVMEDVAGVSYDDPALPDRSPADRAAVMGEMARILAAIHRVDIDAVGLADFGPEGSYYRRQIDRWTKQYRASETEPLADMDALMAWLDRNVPPDDGRRTLVHGDFRLDNLLFEAERPVCVAVLDWELSTLGHPFADLAAVIMQWQAEPGPVARGLAGVDRRALGLPSDAAFIDAYCDHAGIDGIPDFGFYLAFSFFRMAAILQGVKRRALDGNASNPKRGLEMGAFIPKLAAQGLAATG